MTYATLAPPVAEPITLSETKAHLRLDTADEDTLLLSLIRVAREHLERETGLCLIDRTLRLYRDDWPDEDVILIDPGPVKAVTEVTVYDADGLPSTVPLTGYRLDSNARPARLYLPVRPAPGAALNGIEIDFTAGFGSAGMDVPDTLKRALLMHVALMFAFRGAVAADSQPVAVPDGYERLVAAYRLRRL